MILLGRILAQVPSVEGFSVVQKGFAPGKADVEGLREFFVFMGTILACVLLLVFIIHRRLYRAQRKAVAHPTKLFESAMRDLGFHPIDRLLLHLVARSAKLPQPAMILLTPALLEEYAGKWADRLSIRSLRSFARRRVDGVVKLAFVDVH